MKIGHEYYNIQLNALKKGGLLKTLFHELNNTDF
jgi:hypothetical protein